MSCSPTSPIVGNELFPAEQARIVQLLVEQVEVQEDALEVRIRAEGWRASSASCARGREEGCMTWGVENETGWLHARRAHSIRFQRRGGRKRIVTPDGSELVPRSKAAA